jgi:hypothetical protein
MNPQVLDQKRIDEIIERDKFLKDYCKRNNIKDYKDKELIIENKHQLVLSEKRKQKTPSSGVVKVESNLYHLIFDKYQE